MIPESPGCGKVGVSGVLGALVGRGRCFGWVRVSEALYGICAAFPAPYFTCRARAISPRSSISSQMLAVYRGPAFFGGGSRPRPREVGDGTTSVVLLAAELLSRGNDLVKNHVHPTAIMNGSQAGPASPAP